MSFKLVIILLLSILLLIPTVFILRLVTERRDRRDTTVHEITSKWGEQQTVFGPVLIIPYEKYVEKSEESYISHTHYFHILPDDLDILGAINPEVRYRGIYKVITYASDVHLTGKFNAASFSNLPDNADKILWTQARMAIGITDLTGLDAIRQIDWNSRQLEMEGGIPYRSSLGSAVSSPLDIDPGREQTFSIDISLRGSESLFFVPAGKSTSLKLTSTWTTPSFDGAILPDNRSVKGNGFEAEWHTLHLNRPFPQKWSDSAFENEIAGSSYGVNLLVPVDIYQKTTRSVKYAILFIGLTFLLLFFIEVMSKKRVHPVQYLLAGIALVIFYSLLLSLSEHLPFLYAYIIASTSIIGLIAFYTHSLFKNRNYTLITATVLLALYGFLYLVLNLSDMALLLGNIGLFLILALVMFFSRKIDWYNGKQVNISPE